MQIYISEQWSYFAYSLLLGAVCGFIHDLICCIPLHIKATKILAFVLDVTFVCLYSALTIIVAYSTNAGIFRIYAISASICSLFIYKLSFGKTFLRIELLIVDKMLKLFNSFLNMFKILLDFSVKFVKIRLVCYKSKRYKRKLLFDIIKSFSGKEAYGQQRK